MKNICLCIEGGHTLILPSEDFYEIIILDRHSVQASLSLDSYPNRTVVVSGDGDMAYHAAKLAIKYNKNALINGVEVTFKDSDKRSETTLFNELKLLSLCSDQDLFIDSLSNAVEAAVKSCPSKMSIEDARKLLESSCPELNLEFRVQANDGAWVSEFDTSSELAMRRFDEAIDRRNQNIKRRISFDASHERISEKTMRRDEVADHITRNPGRIYLIKWPPGTKKTTLVTKPLFEAACEDNKALLISSSINLTNHMYPTSDSRNYRTALETGTVNEQLAIASTVNSAVLGPAFSKFTEGVKKVIIEEVESVMDMLVSDIIGHDFKMKVEGMKKFNSLLNRDTVIVLDGNMSQNTVDHILKNTDKEIVVINASDIDAKEPKKLTYYADKNVAIERITSIAAQHQKVSVYSDFKNSGSESRFEALYLQMVEILFESELKSMGKKKFTAEEKAEITDKIKGSLNAKLVDASFFKKNKEYIDNPNLLTEEYDLVMSTPAIRNGVSIETKCDLAALIMCGVNSMHDIYQTGYRNRASEETILALTNPRRRYAVSERVILAKELERNLNGYQVDALIDLFERDESAKDIINRIKYLNESRQDFTNNVLCMYEMMNDYVVEYEYSKTTKKHEKKAKDQEVSERGLAYNTLTDWHQVTKASNLERLNTFDSLDINEKRLTYAARVAHFYRLNASHKHFKTLIEFDRGGKGMGFVDNLQFIKSNQRPSIYSKAVTFDILKKLIECLAIDINTLAGDFCKNNYDKFKDWVETAYICFEDGSSESVSELMGRQYPDVSTKQSAALARGLLQKTLGVSIERATYFCDIKGSEIDKRSNDKERHRMMKVVEDDASLLLLAHGYAYPATEEFINATFEDEDGNSISLVELADDDFIENFSGTHDHERTKSICETTPNKFVEQATPGEYELLIDSDARARLSLNKMIEEFEELELEEPC